jgi:hypothetical protein
MTTTTTTNFKNAKTAKTINEQQQQLWDDPVYVTNRVRNCLLALGHASKRLQDNEKIVISSVLANPSTFYFASDRLKDDPAFVLHLLELSNSCSCLAYASQNVRSNRTVIQNAMNCKFFDPKYIGIKLLSDFEFYMDLDEYDFEIFPLAPHKFWKIPSFVEAAVASNPSYLRFASKEICDDEDMVFEAVRRCGHSIEYASDRLKADRTFVMKTVIAKGKALKYVDRAFQDDKELVMKAVRSDGSAFEYVSDRLRDDAQVLRVAINAPSATYPISYASERLRDDKEIALLSINEDPYAFTWVSERLTQDHDVVLATVSGDGDNLRLMRDEFKADEEIALAAIESADCFAYMSVDNSLKNSRDFNLKAVAVGNVFQALEDRFKVDRQIILVAINTNCYVYTMLSEELQEDIQIALQALRSKDGPLEMSVFPRKFNYDPYFKKLHRELRLPLAAQFMLKRHRQYEASKVAAQVDIWMIKNGHCDAFAEHAAAAAKRQRLE